MTPATLAIILMAAFMAGFFFFDIFVGSVYWYLFNDVVPPQFLGRFMGLFRLIERAPRVLPVLHLRTF